MTVPMPGTEQEMNRWIRSQFGHPHGTLGHLVGWVMAMENRNRNKWVVQQLPLKRDSRVLEVGFGPGVALNVLAARLPEGEVVGVDPSSIMVAQAKRRNAESIRKGKMRLIHGTVEGMTGEDGQFDVIYSVNTLGRHYDLERSLSALIPRIRPGGTLAIVHQSPEKQNEEKRIAIRRGIQKSMASAGFTDFQIMQKETKGSPICMVVGRLPVAAVYAETMPHGHAGTAID